MPTILCKFVATSNNLNWCSLSQKIFAIQKPLTKQNMDYPSWRIEGYNSIICMRLSLLVAHKVQLQASWTRKG